MHQTLAIFLPLDLPEGESVAACYLVDSDNPAHPLEGISKILSGLRAGRKLEVDDEASLIFKTAPPEERHSLGELYIFAQI